MIIAGAGVAGSFLAYLLARDGIKVEVYERRKKEDVKPCGGGILRRPIKILGNRVVDGIRINRIVVEYHGKVFEYTGRDLAKSADMNKVVITLREMAESEGAIIHYGKGIAKGFDVDARGARDSKVMGIVGEGIGKYDDAFYFKILSFNPPFTYIWFFPKEYGYSVGIAGPSNWIIKHGVTILKNMKVKKLRMHPIPIYKGNFSGNSMKIGDAASLVDPMNYEGISGAVISALFIWKKILGVDLNTTQIFNYLNREYYLWKFFTNPIFRAFYSREMWIKIWLRMVYGEKNDNSKIGKLYSE